MNRDPVHKLYLHVHGAETPTEAPEVYYRVTARTLARHGGVPLGKTEHKANVTLIDGVWRADIAANTFATIEVFSRFKLGDAVVYSQRNFLHFLTEEDAKGVSPIPVTPIPADWPILAFPEGSYNGMPFRNLQTGEETSFEVKNVERGLEPDGGFLADAEPHGVGPTPITFNPNKNKYTVKAESDPSLLVVVSGPMGGMGKSKTSVAVVPLKDSNVVLTFSLNVRLSKWSYRKLDFGVGLVAFAGIATTTIVVKKRKKFKFNKFNKA
jgi:hypothetical protein